MAVNAKMFLFAFTLILLSCRVDCTDSEKVLEGFVDSGKALIEVIKNFKDEALINDELTQLENKIRSIDLNLEGITPEERRENEESMQLLLSIKRKVISIRYVLSVLAQGTIRKSGFLLKLMSKLGDEPSEGRIKKIMEYSLNKFVTLIGRSNELLGQATIEYDIMDKSLDEIHSQLGKLKSSMEELSNEYGERFERRKRKVRTEVYGGLAACAVGGPVGVSICYAIAVPIIESRIEGWQEKLNDKKNLVNNAVIAVPDLKAAVTSTKNEIADDADKILHWKDVLTDMDYEFKNTEHAIFAIELLKTDVEKMLNDLQQACIDYIA